MQPLLCLKESGQCNNNNCSKNCLKPKHFNDLAKESVSFEYILMLEKFYDMSIIKIVLEKK